MACRVAESDQVTVAGSPTGGEQSCSRFLFRTWRLEKGSADVWVLGPWAMPNSSQFLPNLYHSLSGKWYPISLVLNFLEAPLHDSQRSCNRASLPEAKNLHICVFWSCWACLSLCERSSSGSKACSTACIPKLFYFIQSCSVECPTNNSCTSTRQRTMVKSGSGSRMGTDPQAWPVLVRKHPLFWDILGLIIWIHLNSFEPYLIDLTSDVCCIAAALDSNKISQAWSFHARPRSTSWVGFLVRKVDCGCVNARNGEELRNTPPPTHTHTQTHTNKTASFQMFPYHPCFEYFLVQSPASPIFGLQQPK